MRESLTAHSRVAARQPRAARYTAVFGAPFSNPGPKLGIRMNGDALCAIDFVSAKHPDQPPVTMAARRIAAQLQAYFKNPRTPFTLSLEFHGTPFQEKVWRALQNIPAGTVCSYGELARRLHTGARAIGNACRGNPIPIIIPCHRIVGVQYVPVAAAQSRRPRGSFDAGTSAPHSAHGLGGYCGAYGGAQLAVKRWLLAHEQRT
ncbi:MAG: methylated-DNA--[protein]-cysteine S-methyltransferase [Pseudomonadota bacterium]